ncbi:type IV toxin-antitoxin system AbiEi family antitoxin domain-containing protein [Microbacterium sp. NPDC019599]|uniref:type IV toxin-antitoxin system AbiEi family antitoxin domain-containing protein n=1 Tax=Microbacterium sp. NPDC019599 TaxID=3154690 RepID=UPI0033D8861C
MNDAPVEYRRVVHILRTCARPSAPPRSRRSKRRSTDQALACCDEWIGSHTDGMCSGTPILTTSELLAGGHTRRSIKTSLEAGDLARLRRGVYATPHACKAARVAGTHGGSMACVTAARHLGLWVLSSDATVHVSLRTGGHSHAHTDCRCVEHWDDTRARRSFAVPPVTRILRQILGCLGTEEFFVAVESALRKGLLTETGLDWLRRNSNRRGRRALRLVRWDADSGLESLLRWRLRRYRLEVRTQVAIPSTGQVDLLIGNRLIVEADGRENHEEAGLRHKDLTRDAHAAMWGYDTLRFDYAMIVHDWDLVELAILGRLGLLA